MDIAAIKLRIDTLWDSAMHPSGQDRVALANELFQGTITVLSAVYGPDSEQMKGLRAIAQATILKAPSDRMLIGNFFGPVTGILKNVKDELDSGLIGTLEKRIAGDILGDFIQLAKTALEESEDEAKNVASVLAAAAYEDTIRRMGVSFAGVIGRDDLSKVIDALKDAGILVAPQLGIALSYLNFRNHALHAEWEKIERASVHSVLGFVEQLLLKHFA
jgi:hypothetical protein